ncbi:MAG: glycosyltransferase [Candidatus Sumerlaeia bacterium]|nr:glycosyltransferase [Candidatus Sumerlaeia bacterium]
MEFRFARQNVVCFSTADWDTPLPTNKHQLMRRLARRGARVLYIETLGTRPPKLSSGVDLGRIARRLGRSMEGAQKREKRLWSISPLVRPDWSTSLRVGVNRSSFHFQTNKVLARFPDPIVWIYSPFAVHLLPKMNPRLVVYHMVDDLAAIPGVDVHALREAESLLLERADLVFCTERSLYDRAREISANCHLMPNVADFHHFSRPAEGGDDTRLAALRSLPRPRVLFAGNLADHKVDMALLAEMASKRPDWQLVLIGPEWEGNRPGGALEKLRRMRNVTMVGHVPYEDLPAYIHEGDALVIPYLLNDATRAVSPLKLFEYMATGKPVVTAPLPSVLPWTGAVEVATTPKEWLERLDSVLETPHRGVRQRRALARRHTWERRLEEMAEKIGEVFNDK